MSELNLKGGWAYCSINTAVYPDLEKVDKLKIMNLSRRFEY